jgi:hypothetical protein
MVSVVQAKVPNTYIKFIAPEKFTDFKTKADLRAKDRQMLMDQLEVLISKTVDKIMPRDIYFQFVIHNIDMAGGFLWGHNDMFRVIHDTDRASIHFSYVILDDKGKTIQKDTVFLTSRNPRLLKRTAHKYNHTFFSIEMALFEKWLQELNISKAV